MEELCRGARRKSGRRCHRRCRITTTAVSFKRGNDSNSITCTQHQREGVCNRQKNHKRKGMAGREKKRRVGGSPVTADLTSHVETPAVHTVPLPPRWSRDSFSLSAERIKTASARVSLFSQRVIIIRVPVNTLLLRSL